MCARSPVKKAPSAVRLTTRTGSPYLALELRDRSARMQARAFRDADALAGRFELVSNHVQRIG